MWQGLNFILRALGRHQKVLELINTPVAAVWKMKGDGQWQNLNCEKEVVVVVQE